MTIFLIAAAFAAEPRHFVPEILPPTALVAAIPAPPPYDETVAKWPLDGTTGKAPPLAALWFGTALLAWGWWRWHGQAGPPAGHAVFA